MDSIEALIKAGCSYQYLYEYFNPAEYFDEVYCLSPVGYGITPVGEMIKRENVFYIQAKQEEFYKIINKIQPDIVRSYGGRGCCDLAVANRVKGIPVVVSVHDPNPELISHSLIYADYIICVSETVKKAVRKKLIIDEFDLKVIPNRIDVNVLKKTLNVEYRKKMEKKYGEGKYILHVGRKCFAKNLETVIKSLKYLPKEYKAIFLGNGEAEKYEELARIEGVVERCYFEKAVSKKDLIEYYSWCDCMCTPSRYEGFGFVFIEAAACECVIITSNIGAMNEYLCNGKNAYLVDRYEDEKVLAEKIEKACDDTEENREIKKQARKVGLRFSKDVVDRQDVLFYENIISEKKDNESICKLVEDIKYKKIIIFGAGKRGGEIHRQCEKGKVAWLVDTNPEKTGELIDGIKVISYEQLKEIHSNYLVVVSPEKRDEIEEMLLRDGINFCNMEVYLILKGRIEEENQ